MLDKKRIFISRTGADSDEAIWIAKVLEAEGFSCTIQDRDFDIGNHYPDDIRVTFEQADAVLCVLSKDYWQKPHCMWEWDSAYALGREGVIHFIPVMVKECALPRIDHALTYLNLVDAEPEDRESYLIETVRGVILNDRDLPDTINPDFSGLKNSNFHTPNFTGREEELSKLEAALFEGEGAAALTALHGLGGSGKSAIAREYARTRLNRYAASWLVRAEDPASFGSDLAAFARKCDARYEQINDADQLNQAAMAEAEKLARRRGQPVLFLLDNIESPQAIPKEMRRPGVHILVTSRYAKFGGEFAKVEITSLSHKTAKALFLNSSGRQDEDGLDELITTLDGLPLAIVQAAAYLRENDEEPYFDYLKSLEKRLGEAAFDWDKDEKLVIATYLPSIEQADRMAPGAKDMLTFAAFFAAEEIPFDVVARVFGENAEAARKASTALRLFSLWLKSEDTALGPTRNMHRLLQTILRGGLDEETRNEFAKAAASQVMTPDPGHPQTVVEGWPKWEAILPHAIAMSSNDRTAESPELGTLLSNCASYAQYVMSDYALSERMSRRALAIDESASGPGHPRVALRLNNLALLLRNTNRLEEAEPLMRGALAIDEAAYGPDHPNVAIRLSNLAALLLDTNRLEEAEPLMRRALAIDEAAYGPDHPKFAIRINNLAQLLQETNRLTEAEPLMRRALSIDEAAFGSDHPSVARDLNNLAQLLKAINQLKEAEPLMRRVLGIDEAAFGPDHPDVAVDLNNLAQLLQDTNKLAEAEPLMRRALAIDEAAYGPDHPKVAIRLNNLAALLEDTNRLAEAIPLYHRSKAIFDASLPQGHPHRELLAKNLAIAEAEWATQNGGGDEV